MTAACAPSDTLVRPASGGLRPRLVLLRWLLLGPWRSQPGRLACAVLAIGIGVCLALAIHLVNRSAVGEFGRALAVVNGEAHASIGARATGFDERLFDQVLGDPAIAAASPIVETSLSHDGRSLRVLGLDPMRAAPVTPGLLPSGGDAGGSLSDLFADDAIFLSDAAMRAWQTRPGEVLALRHGGLLVRLRVAGRLAGAAGGEALAVMDLGALQWRLGWLGRLSRIDVRVAEGHDPAVVGAAWASRLPADVAWVTPKASEQRMSNLSRAYRVNLSVLALVALLTGGFIVHATLTLAVARQMPVLALVAMLGASPRFVLAAVLAQGLLLGVLGAALGALAGLGLAGLLLATVGTDLGGGYFSGRPATLTVDGIAVAAYALLGVGVAALASIGPALAARREPPVRVLRQAGEPSGGRPGRAIAAAAAFALAGALLAALPPVAGLPMPAYAAIACWLLAGIALVGPLASAMATLAAAALPALWRSPGGWLALQRLRGSPQAAAVALAGIVASFALSSAMTIMVDSFRHSVADWLDAVLPADVYGRLASRAPGGGISPEWQAAIAATEGVAEARFLRSLEIGLAPERPPVGVLARDVDRDAPHRSLPMVGPIAAVGAGERAAWVSEPMSELYGLRPGSLLELPLGGGLRAFRVAGVWRDYARQHGAVVLDRGDYIELTGDRLVSDVALRLGQGADEAALIGRLRARLGDPDALEWRSSRELRELSLRIFDRSFAITRVLEAIAIAVGLFGVAATYAGQALARAREFGVLRHLGVTRAQVAGMFGIESAALIACGVVWGAALGAVIAAILVHRVNPQSFHWTMTMHWPMPVLAGSAAALVALGTLAAVLASRGASGTSPIRAVRDDW
jgi:putative ABC transport system permease protein